MSEYKLVLGLEIHMHLKTKTKMFCRCDANFYDSEPNTHTCPVCLGLPGALPVPNYDAVVKTQLLGLALNCNLNKSSKFDRKHYFYPDLSKGYQISQYKQPLCENGYVILSSGKKIEIERIHLEEDTAKSMHKDGDTLIDFNKSGMPLVEIVTRPVFSTAEEAVEFCKKIQDLVRILKISDVDMEKGQMRLEANISMRTVEMEHDGKFPSYKVEVKNINSFRFMEKAVNAEIKRQTEMLEKGETPIQENRGYDENKNKTVSQRSKENAHDYRYFPEPDIPPMEFSDEAIEEIRNELPELPEQLKTRLIAQYRLNGQNAEFLSNGVGLDLVTYFERICSLNIDPSKVANLIINKPEFRNLTDEQFLAKIPQSGEMIDDEVVLENAIKKIIDENKDAFENYKAGNEGSANFLIGQIMRETKGKANPQTIKTLLEKTLG